MAQRSAFLKSARCINKRGNKHARHRRLHLAPGDRDDQEPLGRFGVARIGTSAGGDLSEHIYVLVDDNGIRDSDIVRRHSYRTGWTSLVARCLDGGDEDVCEEHRETVIELATLLTGDGPVVNTPSTCRSELRTNPIRPRPH